MLTSSYDGAERLYSLSGTFGSTTTNYVTQAFYWPNGIPWYYVRGGSNNVWHVNAINSRMQVPETYEAIGNNNNSTQMLFVSCPNWGVNPNNYGAYDICPHSSGTNDNGNLQGYSEYHGGSGYSSLLSFSQTLGYDNVNRLTSATDNGGWSRNFGYDQFGNMAPTVGSGTNSISLAGNTPTAFNSYNQISGPTGTTYDNAGNQTLVNGNSVGYDAENRATTLAGFAFGYVFDGLGQRVEKTQYSHAPTAYVYDAFGQLAAEYAGGTTWTTDYIRWGSGGALIATENAGGTWTTCYFGYDHLGSMRLVMDQSANVIGRHDFLPYGEEVPASTAGRNSSFGPSNDSVTTKFTGQLRDSESGMDYFAARNFTASLGRFMSPDPGNAGASLVDPQTWNAYAYVRNSPLHMIDPSGMDGFGSNPGEGGDPCWDDPFACDPGPVWFPLPSPSPPPAPPPVTEGMGGNPLPPGSFPNGETLGLPRGIGVPSTLQSLLGLYSPNPYVFSICSGSSGCATAGLSDPTAGVPILGAVSVISFSKAIQGNNPDPTKGARPIKDANGRIIGWSLPAEGPDKGDRIKKTLDWGRHKGLDPADPKWINAVGSVAVGAGLVDILWAWLLDW